MTDPNDPKTKTQSVTNTDFSTRGFSGGENIDVPVEFSKQPQKVPQVNPEPPPESSNQSQEIIASSVTIESKKGSNWFRIFVIIGILVILSVYSIVAYLYYKNTSLKEIVSNINNSSKIAPIPTPSFNRDNIVIENGNVVYKDNLNEVKIIIDKNSYPTTGITGFSHVLVSPDDKSICFESIPPSTKPALFIADIDGNNAKTVSSNKSNCLWIKDSKKIVYSGKETGLQNINVYSYDIEQSLEVNLTKDATSSTSQDYEIVGLSSDESSLICSYTDKDSSETSQCQINLESGEVTSSQP